MAHRKINSRKMNENSDKSNVIIHQPNSMSSHQNINIHINDDEESSVMLSDDGRCHRCLKSCKYCCLWCGDCCYVFWGTLYDCCALVLCQCFK